MHEQPRELVVLDEASRAIASVRTIDEARELRDKAEAVKAYARKARLSREILVQASVIKARAGNPARVEICTRLRASARA